MNLHTTTKGWCKWGRLVSKKRIIGSAEGQMLDQEIKSLGMTGAFWVHCAADKRNYGF